MKRPISTAAIILLALGGVCVAAALYSLGRPSPERSARFVPSRDLSEAVADPDVMAPPAYLP